MNIPSRVNPFGYDNSIPPGYVGVEYLESTGTQYIDIESEIQYSCSVKCDAQYTTPTYFHQLWGWQDSGRYLGPWMMSSGSGGFMYNTASNAAGMNVADKRMLYTFDGKNARAGLGNAYLNFNKAADIELGFSSAIFCGKTRNGATWMSSARIFLFEVVENDEAIRLQYIPALDPTGTPCMFDTVTRKPFKNNGSGQFIAGMTMAQALNLAKLPATGGSLTISLPKEARLVQHNQRVESALATATEKGWIIPVQYREAGDEAILNKYAECTVLSDIIAVNADYINDLTDEGEWIYPLPEITRFPNTGGDWWHGVFFGSSIKKIKAVFPKCTYSQALLAECKNAEEVDLEFPIATRVSSTLRWANNYKKVRIIAPEATYFEENTSSSAKKFVDCEYYAPKAQTIENLCRNASVLEEIKGEFGANATILRGAFYGCPKLRVFPTYYPKASDAGNMLYGCEISAETAIAILDSFPKWTSGSHLVTVGIHVDYQNDESVAEAVANAEAKGWAVTLQWNGTATAQASATYGLRRQPIYAKRGTMELPDGTTEDYLDWGHYVTNWEGNGYMEFASIEEAEEHFNIKKEPEE